MSYGNFIKCNKCGSLNPVSAKYCYQCNNDVRTAEAPIVCVKCGVVNNAVANFCKQCGNRIAKSPTTKRCPQCGAVCPMESQACPNCAYNYFNDIEAAKVQTPNVDIEALIRQEIEKVAAKQIKEEEIRKLNEEKARMEEELDLMRRMMREEPDYDTEASDAMIAAAKVEIEAMKLDAEQALREAEKIRKQSEAAIAEAERLRLEAIKEAARVKEESKRAELEAEALQLELKRQAAERDLKRRSAGNLIVKLSAAVILLVALYFLLLPEFLEVGRLSANFNFLKVKTGESSVGAAGWTLISYAFYKIAGVGSAGSLPQNSTMLAIAGVFIAVISLIIVMYVIFCVISAVKGPKRTKGVLAWIAIAMTVITALFALITAGYNNWGIDVLIGDRTAIAAGWTVFLLPVLFLLLFFVMFPRKKEGKEIREREFAEPQIRSLNTTQSGQLVMPEYDDEY